MIIKTKREVLREVEKIFLDGYVFRIALSFCKNIQDAEDLAQNVFEKALKNLDKVSEVRNLEAWLFTVTRNAFLSSNSLFANKKVKLCDGRKIDVLYPHYCSDGFDEYCGEMSPLLVNFIDNCHEEQARSLLLKVVWGYNHEEIAQMMGTTVGTSLSRVRRARRKIEKSLKDRGINCSKDLLAS